MTYNGSPGAGIAAAPPVKGSIVTASGEVLPPEGIHPDAGNVTANLPLPPGATKERVALGEKILTGQVNDGTCGGCHGSDAAGGPIGPDLTSGKWLWSDGSLKGITQTIIADVPQPKTRPGAMPAMGGTQLSAPDLKAVAAYVWAVGHQSVPNQGKRPSRNCRPPPLSQGGADEVRFLEQGARTSRSRKPRHAGTAAFSRLRRRYQDIDLFIDGR